MPMRSMTAAGGAVVNAGRTRLSQPCTQCIMYTLTVCLLSFFTGDEQRILIAFLSFALDDRIPGERPAASLAGRPLFLRLSTASPARTAIDHYSTVIIEECLPRYCLFERPPSNRKASLSRTVLSECAALAALTVRARALCYFFFTFLPFLFGLADAD